MTDDIRRRADAIAQEKAKARQQGEEAGQRAYAALMALKVDLDALTRSLPEAKVLPEVGIIKRDDIHAHVSDSYWHQFDGGPVYLYCTFFDVTYNPFNGTWRCGVDKLIAREDIIAKYKEGVANWIVNAY